MKLHVLKPELGHNSLELPQSQCSSLVRKLFALLHRSGLLSNTIPIPVEQHTCIFAYRALQRLDPLAGPKVAPKTPDEAQRTIHDIRAIVLAHDCLDAFGSLVCMVEGDGADVVVKDVCLYNAVEELSSNEAKLPVDGGGSSSGISPCR